ncbi:MULTISPECIES: EF-hand domain-containing protein [Pseudoxanthomonas]|uniref:EF-hand domain-containing protein n=1 Tax=Pseudoxanthomonas winnipegensis TaxID=2480810 RepID=A0AAW8G641_9GAMM|nr:MULTISPECIES: EF-hand domain-containing protein [Pseudoxanthomonas]MDQ1117722.1 hypothetical protein [Pseudoxanthomonas winnipegensis]MDQ1134690.1 hypothetical protein [Pseudoxanthomonas winnipegensis]MDR6139076.1 hypothetical protein [Pseudoxanthomonas sp. SORGH_AS_0997]TBV74404.1 EF-hand domain-containing protein [Pseudoxanthomonas winnipegensis]
MKRLRFHAFPLVLLSSSVLVAPALAQSQQPTLAPAAAASAAPDQRQQRWDDLDANHDGSISKAEAAGNAGLSQVFDQVDANADGAVSLDEYKAFVTQHYGPGAGEPAPGR